MLPLKKRLKLLEQANAQFRHLLKKAAPKPTQRQNAKHELYVEQVIENIVDG